MPAETVTHGEPAGHTDEGPLPRMATTESRLRSKVEDWLRYVQKNALTEFSNIRVLYQLAHRDLEGISLRVPELEACVTRYAEHPAISAAGALLSLAYQMDPAADFKYSLTAAVPLDYVGYKFPVDKSLHITAPIGKHGFCDGDGLAILDAEVPSQFGSQMTTMINRVAQRERPADYANYLINIDKCFSPNQQVPGFVIDYGPPHDFWVKEQVVIAWPLKPGVTKIHQLDNSHLIIASPCSIKLTVEHRGHSRHVSYEAYQRNLPLKVFLEEIRSHASGDLQDCIAYFRKFGSYPGFKIKEQVMSLARAKV